MERGLATMEPNTRAAVSDLKMAAQRLQLSGEPDALNYTRMMKQLREFSEQLVTFERRGGMTLDQCIKDLLLLIASEGAYLESRVDMIVDDYLVQRESEKSTARDQLARAFKDVAPLSGRTDRIMARILKESAN